jgi:hypothetical protein
VETSHRVSSGRASARGRRGIEIHVSNDALPRALLLADRLIRTADVIAVHCPVRKQGWTSPRTKRELLDAIENNKPIRAYAECHDWLNFSGSSIIRDAPGPEILLTR